MGAVADFFVEADQLFGLHFDIGMSFAISRKRLETLQREHGMNDESPFMFADRSPTELPEVEMERSLHSTSLGALKQRIADPGFDLVQSAHSIVVFVYHLWDERFRGLLARERNVASRSIQIDVFGDLRLIRNSLIHNRGIAATAVAKCKVITRFKPGDRIEFTKLDIHDLVRELRRALTPYA